LEIKPVSEFYISNRRPDKLRGACKKCERKRNVKRDFGINPEEYDKMKKECSICRSKRILHIDHDHLTGRVRGILCVNCNIGLGNFRDNIELLERAIIYLRY
jgi:hypothetical protein